MGIISGRRYRHARAGVCEGFVGAGLFAWYGSTVSRLLRMPRSCDENCALELAGIQHLLTLLRRKVAQVAESSTQRKLTIRGQCRNCAVELLTCCF